MKQVRGNIWDYHRAGQWVGITTNGFVKKDGTAVLGAGIAKEATRRYPDLPKLVGAHLKENSNTVAIFQDKWLFTFPVKPERGPNGEPGWSMAADLALISRSAVRLKELMESELKGRVFLVRPGCGNGRLTWSSVEPVIEKVFADEDRLTIVDWVRE